MLEGWPDEWVQPLRASNSFIAADVGRELARTAEALDQPALALKTWRELLAMQPCDVDAVRAMVRLESELNGQTAALQVAEKVQRELGPNAPAQLLPLLASLRAGIFEAVPKPEILRTRGEILMLARLFESNLNANREESLALLLAEGRKEGINHPRTAFSLVQLGLSATTGASPTRVQLAKLAALLGSWVGEYEIAHQWAGFALENLDPTSADFADTLGSRGFMLFEQRQNALAEKVLRDAVQVARRNGFANVEIANEVRLAGVLMQTMRFEDAVHMYRGASEKAESAGLSNASSVKAATHLNIAIARCMEARWEGALAEANAGLPFVGDVSIYEWIGALPHGLALLATGQREAGIRQLSHGIASMAREKMLRYHQIALDFAVVAFALEGERDLAQELLDANSVYRASIRHHRSEAETHFLVNVAGLSTNRAQRGGTLLQQSTTTTTAWVIEALARLGS